MAALVAFSCNPVDPSRFDEIGSRASLVLLAGQALDSVVGRAADIVDARRFLFVALGEGRLGRAGLAAALGADWLALRESATLDFGTPRIDARVAGGAIRRIGERARRLLLTQGCLVTASDAVRLGLADSLVAEDEDSLKWLDAWIGKRSVRALLSGSSLIRRRGGDPAERAEFGRLFGEGEPQRGLRRFLEKRPLDFSDDVQVVTI